MPAGKVTNSTARYQPYDLTRRPLHIEERGVMSSGIPVETAKSTSQYVAYVVNSCDLGKAILLENSPRDAILRLLPSVDNQNQAICQQGVYFNPSGVFCADASNVKPFEYDGTYHWHLVVRDTRTGYFYPAALYDQPIYTSPLISPEKCLSDVHNRLYYPLTKQQLNGLCYQFHTLTAQNGIDKLSDGVMCPTLPPPTLLTDAPLLPSSDAPTEGNGGLSAGAIAGLTLGVSFLVGFVVVGGVLGGYYIYKKCRPDTRVAPINNEDTERLI